MMKLGELVGVGNTASVYQWGETEVIKVFKDRGLAIHEAKKAEMIQRLPLKAPQCAGMIEHDGHSCIIYEKIDGTTMLRQIEPTVTSVSQNARLMAQLQFEIHDVEIKAPVSLKSEMANKIKALQEVTGAGKQMILDNLHELPEGQMLCHYDFHPDNIILSSKGPVIIDWMNTLVGPKAADVARSSMMLQSNALPRLVPQWLKNRRYREMFHEEYLTTYLNLSGMDKGMIEEWMIPTLAVRIHEMQGEERKEIVDRLNDRLRQGKF